MLVALLLLQGRHPKFAAMANVLDGSVASCVILVLILLGALQLPPHVRACHRQWPVVPLVLLGVAELRPFFG